MIDDDILELETFIRQINEIVHDLAIQLAPVFHRMAAIREEIGHTHERDKDGHIIGFRGARHEVQSRRICAVRELGDGERAFDYAEVPAMVIMREASDIESRQPLFDELDRLADVYGPDRNRLRDLNAEIRSAANAIARLERRKKQKPPQRKPTPSAIAQQDRLL